jgi:hypothetical protein
VSTLVEYAALACVAAGILVAALIVLTTGNGWLALRVALDFWLAAGLLRLGQVPGWEPLLSAALIIAIRQLAGRALRPPEVHQAEMLTFLRQTLGARSRPPHR